MVISIRDSRDEHIAFEELLPWYVTGQLPPDEMARAEAHLEACAACREQLADEHDLRDAVARSSVEPEEAWTELRRRLDIGAHPPDRARRAVSAALARPSRLIAIVAAQAAVVLMVVVVTRPPAVSPASPGYTVLGSAPPAATGNVMVVFQPDATERQLRGTLERIDAAIVGGPTPADAYVLRVPAAERDAALETLRAEPHVVLAQAIDAEVRR